MTRTTDRPKSLTEKFKSVAEQFALTQVEKPKSTIGFRYPSIRDRAPRDSSLWLEGKRADDRAEGLWRVHDDLYDFTDFVNLHPGGADWLELTKGTDITEAFEVHHFSNLPKKYLQNYFVREAKGPRNSPFTFEEDGFYKTLKRRATVVLDGLPDGVQLRTKVLTDSVFLGFLLMSVLAIRLESFTIGVVAASLLTMTSIAAHNYVHTKDSFRMYYFGATFMSYRDFRITHALSHHIYPNTVYDIEVSFLEPIFQYLPSRKNFLARYVSWVYSPIVYMSLYFSGFIKRLIELASGRQKVRFEDFIPLLLFLFLFLVGGQILSVTLKFVVWIEFVSSFIFTAIGLNAGHHHPDVFHDGDAARPVGERDWGMHQVDSVMERMEITGSQFLVLISFGDHALHHLFPTVDHGKLEYLYPVFKETCRDFGVEFMMSDILECTKGQFRQLAKIEPNKNPPRFMTK